MIQNLINDINRAKSNEAYISALALALTLPDICGKIEYQNSKVGFRYVKWYDNWVYKYFEQKESENEFIARAENVVAFDGVFCYQLRCAILHSGNTEIIVNGVKWDTLELSVCKSGKQKGYALVCDVSNSDVKNINVNLNVVHLIDAIILGVKGYLTDKGDIFDVYGNISIELL